MRCKRKPVALTSPHTLSTMQGITQIPAGSQTVLPGPFEETVLDELTGHLVVVITAFMKER